MALTTWSQILLLICILIYLIVTVIIFVFMNDVQKQPYMDEEFHIPQAQKFCQGKIFEWNPKITTPPGLYLLSMGILRPLSQLFSRNLCTTYFLRFINVFFNTGNLYLFYCISCKLHQNTSSNKLLFMSVNMALLPVLYFFTFLYYTDAGSLFFVMLMYQHRLYHKDFLAATFGFISLLFRQTNIIWIFFVAADRTFEIIQKQILLDKKYSNISKASAQYLFTVLSFTICMPFYQKRLFATVALDIVKSCIGYMLVSLSFISFLLWNQGIVVGDRNAHVACFHLAQLFYFLGFAFVFSCSHFWYLNRMLRFTSFCMNHFGLVILVVAGMALCLHGFSYSHPYLLADNRHYPFYLWRWVLGHPYLRHALIPIYLYSAWAFTQVFQTKNSIWKLLFLVCVLLSTIPQWLIEFRYFIIPFVIMRLNYKCGPYEQLFHELITYLVFNFLTIGMFMFRPFFWKDNSNVQRFMW